MSETLDNRRLAALRLVAFDVDGVFTDGRFYLADDGTESKAFNTQDGFGIRQLMKLGIEIAVISGRRSEAVNIRMGELGVRHVHLACADKVAAFQSILDGLSLPPAHSAFVGDDVPDLPLLEFAGVSFAVANAVPAVKQACDHVTSASGGRGAVREICDMIAAAKTADS